ncbi:hypothetical protein ACFXHA_17260 [Nocardia sp. NPDC059240]|uniref:hypothetical protein n=1 Tax=Nocardia sp. NPDC059240 TaxID=3346786 RepID=UPI0036A03A7A
MARRAMTRTAGTTAAAIGVLALIGSGTAGAAPATLTWNNNGTQYTHTVSDGTPAVGETITVTTTLSRTQDPDETYDWFKDFHPSCLTYVTGSATVTDSTGTHQVEPYLQIDPNFIAGDFTTAGLKLVAKAGSTPSPTFSAQYQVGSCTPGTALNTGIAYLSSAGQSDFSTRGPSITVGGTPGGGTGTGSSNLTSLLGGFGSSK